MIDFNKIEATPEGLKKAIIQLQEDFDAHNHDGTNSKKFETITVDAISAELLSIRKLSYGDNKTGFWAGIIDNIMKFFVGNPTNYLKWDGEELSYTGKTRQTMKLSTIFENSARFTQTKSTEASITFGEAGVVLNTSATANKYARVEIKTSGAGSSSKPFNDSAFSAIANISERGTVSGYAGIAYVGVWNQGSTADGTTLDLSSRDQYGFKFVKTDGFLKLYATSSNTDNNTEQETFIYDIVEDAICFLAASVQTGKVKFFVEIQGNTFSIEHTSQVPKTTTSEDNCGFLFVNNANTADVLELEVSSYTFEKFSVGVY